MSVSKSRGLGPVPEGVSEQMADFLGQVRRVIMDVQAGRIATLQLPGATKSSGGSSTPDPGSTDQDLTPPPTPSGVNVVAGMDFIGISTDAPTFTTGHGYLATIVYGAKYSGAGPLPTFADAKQVHDFIGEVGSFPTDAATQWHIWLKWKSKDGVQSAAPAGGVNGFQATTGQDVTKLLQALAGKVKGEQLDPASTFVFRASLFTIAPASGGLPDILPFTVLTAPTMTPAGELLPAGTYIDAAYIRNLEAALGRFQNAFITNAMIVSVSASRLTSGVISVGNYIQSSGYVAGSSGWRISGDGSAEFSAASIRGKLTASQIETSTLVIGAGQVSGLGALATQNSVSAGNVSGLGTLATQNSVTSAQVSGLGTLATQNSVSWSSQVSGIPTNVANARPPQLFRQTSQPGSSGLLVGDMWQRLDQWGGIMESYTWNGSSWIPDSRGPVTVYATYSGSATDDTTAWAQFGGDTATNAAFAAAGLPAPRLGDIIVYRNTAGTYAGSRQLVDRNALGWTPITAFINGSMVVTGGIKAQHISVASLSALSATIGTLQTSASGARTKIADNLIQVFSSSNAERVRISS